MNVPSARLLITGASGFIGRALAGQAAGDWRLRLGVRRPLASALHETVVANLDNPRELEAAVDGVDCIVHLAGLAHNRAPADQLAALHEGVNNKGTIALAQAAHAAHVRRFVFVSTAKVFGDASAAGRPFTSDDLPAPPDSYARSKWAAERALTALFAGSRTELVIVRPPLVYGPGVGANMQRLMRWVHRGIPLPLAAVDNRRTLVALDNLVSLLLCCVKHPQATGRPLLVGDGEDISTPELIRLMARCMGRPARLWPVPVSALRLGAALVGRTAEAQRLCGSLQFDTGETRSRLDWTPPVTLEAGVSTMVADFLASRGSA